MPGTIVQIQSGTALEEAIKYVTKDRTLEWTFSGWTRSNFFMWKGQPGVTGMRSSHYHYSKGWQNFTIRHDHDFAHGNQQDGGKGYHVNVELPDEKLAFCIGWVNGRSYAEDCWKYMCEHTLDFNSDDQAAAAWFMGPKGAKV